MTTFAVNHLAADTRKPNVTVTNLQYYKHPIGVRLSWLENVVVRFWPVK